jgi:23S rRNA (cytosine1962-C5)-methyltransferase
MPSPVLRPSLAVADGWKDYRLLDCGDGMKRERWGPYVLVRPDPQIIWPRRGEAWAEWDGYYHRSETGGGSWEFRRELPADWKLGYEALGLTFRIKPTSFKHTGLFPEQAVNWDWMSGRVRAARESGRQVSVLNLFGYTGAATCAVAKAGASVCHVDASEGMVKWCRENAALSGLASAPIRTIVDDCLKFARREAKRGHRYDAVIMDPPTYGRGSSGEMWRLEDNLWTLLLACRELLSDSPIFFLINAYTARLSPTVTANLLAELMDGRGGAIEAGEVGLPVASDGKVLPCGIFGRWSA